MGPFKGRGLGQAIRLSYWQPAEFGKSKIPGFKINYPNNQITRLVNNEEGLRKRIDHIALDLDGVKNEAIDLTTSLEELTGRVDKIGTTVALMIATLGNIEKSLGDLRESVKWAAAKPYPSAARASRVRWTSHPLPTEMVLTCREEKF